jgi:hypothetical protein
MRRKIAGGLNKLCDSTQSEFVKNLDSLQAQITAGHVLFSGVQTAATA